MSLSPRLALPYLAPAQSQKHVTVNDSLRKLDAIVQLSVVSRTTLAQPGAPADGDVYILPSGKTGAAWATMTDLSLAYFVDGAWSQLTSKEGWRAFVQDSNEFIFYDGAAWTGAETPLWGVNTPADAANKLAVKSNAVLFDALDAAEGGTGDAQVKVNKEAAGDNASHLFQTGFSGRAEIGLAGDDDFHLKVSADGAAWLEAIVVKTDGKVGIGTAAPGGKLDVVNSAASFLRYDADGQVHIRKDGGNRPRINLLDTGGFGEGYLDFYTFPNQTVPSLRWQGIDTGSWTGAHVFWTAAGGAPNSPLVERLRIAANGDVSIGAIIAAVKLDVDGPVKVKSYLKAALPSAAAGAGQMIYVSDEVGGAVIAFSDGASWRRVTDRAVVA